MKKQLLAAAIASGTFLAGSVQASSVEGLGVAVNYGLISGPALELTYPINEYVQVRGALSAGMSLKETANDTDIAYDVKADGGIHRLNVDYHPFGGTFFLSAGYAFNDFKLKADGSKTGTVDVGNDTFAGTVNVNGQIDWDSAPMLSLGWGHSPAQGWGAMVEIGAIFTGAPDVSLTGTLDGSQDSTLDAALADEEKKLKRVSAFYD
jgi:hypothetical protein